MSFTSRMIETAVEWAPVVGVLVVGAAGLTGAHRVLIGPRALEGRSDDLVGRHLLLVLAGGLVVVTAILAMPVSDATHGQLLGFLGVLVTAAIALSSTTLMGNVMAGLMLRTIRPFRPGDFVKVEGHFGRVSDLGLLHIELQTEDRDLTTLPNLFVVQHPVSVMRTCGTIVSATVSLGYDVPRRRVEAELCKAAEDAGLAEPFVHLIELGDFSITYRVAGFLEDVKVVLSTRSQLRGAIIDHLHTAGIEIVSPRFMNQRQIPVDEPVLAQPLLGTQATTSSSPEGRIFDKAEAAESREQIADAILQIDQRVESLKAEREQTGSASLQVQLDSELERLASLRAQLVTAMDEMDNGAEE